eukprot:COSAG06_NODE_667_length_13266_cov_25.994532_6_plen_181_part_00
MIIIRFKLALPMLKHRPLALEFTSAVAESTDVVPPWIQAGLLEIGLVRRHENMKLLQHRKKKPKCCAPHWDGEACCEEEDHQGMKCPLERASSGWRMLARMDSTPQQQEPEPEPEPEPELEPEPEPESAVKVHVPQSFVKMAVMWAAMDAGRDAVARLRKHEEENRRHAAVAEGVPPGGS